MTGFGSELSKPMLLELGGHVRKGEHGTKVYFVKQLQVRDKDTDGDAQLGSR